MAESKKPVALEYLDRIGVDVSTQVTGLLVTHWHGDHIKGASQLFQECAQAAIFISAALQQEEAISLACLYQRDLARTDKGIGEFRKIVDFIYNQQNYSRIIPTTSNTYLFNVPTDNASKLVALSPSSQATLLSSIEFQYLLPKLGTRSARKRIFPRGPNFNAVATHFTFGSFSALLGSDLEDSGNVNTGWSAVVGSGVFKRQGLSKSNVFKVAHHGSENGHNAKVWEELLIEKPLAITTPFSSHKLPKPTDTERIAKLAGEFVVTKKSESKKKIRRDRMVEREMSSIARDRNVIDSSMGHIQIRAKLDGSYKLNTNDHCISY